MNAELLPTNTNIRHEWVTRISEEPFHAKNDTALIAVAHPDDEAFISGTIRKLRNKGKQVVVIALTDGGASTTINQDEVVAKRQEEAKEAMRRLDVNIFVNLGFTDGDLLYQRQEAVMRLTQYMRILDATVVIGHNAIDDYHPDHTSSGSITEEALFKARNANHLIPGIPLSQKIPAYYEMDTQGSKNRYGKTTEVQSVVRIRKKELLEKEHAFAAYESQVFELAPDGKNTHRERLTMDTRRRGMTAGMTWGEGLSQVTYGGEKFATDDILREWLGKREYKKIPENYLRRKALEIKGTVAGLRSFI